MRGIKQSKWRLINAPATIGDDFNGAIIVPMLPIMFLSMIFKVYFINYIPLFFICMEFYRMKKKLPTIRDTFKYIFFKFVTKQYWYGYRRAAYGSLTSIAGALLLVSAPMPSHAGINVFKPVEAVPTPNVAQGSQSVAKPLGGEFIDNVSIIKGAGPSVDLELLLKQIMPATYSIQFKSVEIASMRINWRSTNWTLDQVLGNISLRYGIMFETMQGSSVVSIDWLDERKCKNNENKLFKRICGNADGFYVD